MLWHYSEGTGVSKKTGERHTPRSHSVRVKAELVSDTWDTPGSSCHLLPQPGLEAIQVQDFGAALSFCSLRGTLAHVKGFARASKRRTN